MITFLLPRRPAKELRVVILSGRSDAEEWASILIRVVARPKLEAQTCRLYDGEPVTVMGEGFFDQLDLWCTLGSDRAPATVLNSTAL